MQDLSQSNQINSNNYNINHQQAVVQPKTTFLLQNNQPSLSTQFETNVMIDSTTQQNSAKLLNQTIQTQKYAKVKSHNDQNNIFQYTNTIQNNNPQNNGDTHSQQTSNQDIEQSIGSKDAKDSSHSSNQKQEKNMQFKKKFDQDHKFLRSEEQENSYLSDLDNQLLSSAKEDENNYTKGLNKIDDDQSLNKSVSLVQYQNQIDFDHPKVALPNTTLKFNEITNKNKDNHVIIDKQQSEKIDQMNSSRDNLNDFDDQSAFQKDKSQRISMKKRTRKRLEKKGSENNDQIDYVSNLQRAKTKIFEEDKHISDLKIDASAFRTNSLQIQKFQSVATNSGPSLVKGKINQQQKMGRWTKDEHFRFLVALKLYGKEWRKVQEHVLTRTSTQARSHAQKFFQKLEKRNQNLEEFLLALDVNNLEKHCIMSDLEDENSPRGPQVKGKNNKSKQKYGARNSTLVIPDVVIPPKQPIVEEQQKDQDEHQVNSDQSEKYEKIKEIKTECKLMLNQNPERIQEVSKDNRSSHSKKEEINEQNSKKSSSSSNQKEQENDLSNQKNLDDNLNQCSQSNQQSIQSPKKTKEKTNENNQMSLLTKRINPQQQMSEFQLPLPKKTFNQLKSPQDEHFSSEQRKRSGSQKNLVTIVQGNNLQKKQMYISIKQQHMSPHLPKQNANKLELMNKKQQFGINEPNIISQRQITTINQPIIQPVISGIYTLGAQNSGNQSAPPIGRPHSNSLSGTTQPHSTLLAQKINSTVVAGNGLQQNSQFSAMTGANNNMTAQFPMTPNLRHSATSVMNCNVGYSILDLEAQHYSVISQMSNANYQQQKYGKEKARANSFDEGFFKNILDKDHEENDYIDENTILPHIQAALVNKIKEFPIPIAQGMPIDHKNNYYNDGMKNEAMNSHNRMNMTPKTKYHTVFNMSHSAAQQQTLGFDDGLQRMRSNLRRDDSHEPLLTQEDHQGQVENETSKENNQNQHLIGQQDFNQQIQQQAVLQAAIQGYSNTNQPYNVNPQQFNYSMYDQGINQIIQQRNQNQGLSQLLSLQNSNLQIDPNMNLIQGQNNLLQNSNVRTREQQQYLMDQQIQSNWKQQETLKALQKQQQAHQVAALQYQQSINNLQEQRPIFNLDQQPNRQLYQVSDQNLNQQQVDQRQQLNQQLGQREEFWKQKVNQVNQQQAQAQYISDQQQLLSQIQRQSMQLQNRQLKATDGQVQQ